MRGLKEFVFHNWFIKLLSLALAVVLWMSVASESTSEIGIQVPVEYRNVPANSEIISENADSVEVRLRGPSRLIREISSQDISTTIDVNMITPGEKIVPLTTQNIRAPFGVEVVSVTPSRINLVVEKTIAKKVAIGPKLTGAPAKGYVVATTTAIPAEIEVAGPESHVSPLRVLNTTAIDVSGKREGLNATVGIDLDDSLVRIPANGSVRVQVVIVPGKE